MTILFAVLAFIFFLVSCYLAYPWLRERYSFRQYLDEYRSAESLMEHVYTSRNGTKVYQYKNVLNLPPKRAIKAELQMKLSTLCLTAKMFDEYTAAMKAACNKNDLQRVGYLIGRMEERRTLPAEENTLAALSDTLLLLEGENPKATSEFWMKKKRKLWEEDDDCYAFFLHVALTCTRDIKEQSPEETLRSLRFQAEQHLLHRL